MVKKSILLFSIIFLAGCVNPMLSARYELQEFPLKIGLLADSQITTSRETFQNVSFRSPAADKVTPVSIRPPALEYLSSELLSYFLERLAVEEVDLILYLGDAANSGCEDELEKVFSLLAKTRDDNGIPVYFLIGNHDYLGTGNQTLDSVRRNLCDRSENNFSNLAVSKIELIQMIHDFNILSSQMDTNFNYLNTSADFTDFRQNGECEDSHNFVYYAAGLKSKNPEKNSVDILLADTSDYNNVWFRPLVKGFSHCELLGGWGLKGSMSSEQLLEIQSIGCQIEEKCDVKQFLESGVNPQFGVDYRIVASHYDPKSFNALYPWNFSPSFVKDNLGYLLSDGENIWLAAHHHYSKPDLATYPVGKTIFPGPRGEFTGFSVGSTTDDRPHVSIIEALNSENNFVTSNVGARTLFAPEVGEVCSENVIKQITSTINSLEPISCSASYNDIESMLGTEKIYDRKFCWNKDVYETIQSNIEIVLSSFYSPELRASASLCLAVKGAINEGPVAVP